MKGKETKKESREEVAYRDASAAIYNLFIPPRLDLPEFFRNVVFAGTVDYPVSTHNNKFMIL